MRKLKALNQADYPLTIIEDLGMLYPTKTSKQKKRFIMVVCPFCQRHFPSETTSVKDGRATKCKSCSSTQTHTTHGETKTRLHNIWVGLRDRCNNPNHTGYQNYGGKGLQVCPEWDDYNNFKTWAIANNYSDTLSIDRKDNDKGYSPENCRWTTKFTQMQNTRLINSTNTSGYRGVYPEYNKFVAAITVNYKKYRLGVFDNAIDAAKAYDDFVTINSLEHPMNGV